MDMHNDVSFRTYFTKVGVSGVCGDITANITKSINLDVVPDLATISSISCIKKSSYISYFNVKGIRFYKFCFLTGEMQFSSHSNLTSHIAFNVGAVPNNSFETCGTAYGMTAGANVRTLANSGDIYIDIQSSMTVLRFTLPYICN